MNFNLLSMLKYSALQKLDVIKYMFAQLTTPRLDVAEFQCIVLNYSEEPVDLLCSYPEWFILLFEEIMIYCSRQVG